MNYKYQVGLLGGTGKFTGRITETLKERLADLGLNHDSISFLYGHELGKRDRKAPFVGIFFGYDGATDPGHPEIAPLIADSVVLIPVIEKGESHSGSFPKSIEHINALWLDTTDQKLESVAALVFESFRLLRTTRRLFISYRRAESTSIAMQLYESLDARGFDVFLDTHSVRPAEPFQEVLWHRLADSDILVLLDTPDFLKSAWTTEELAKANLTMVQTLQLVWPNHTAQADAALSKIIRLSNADFVNPTDQLSRSSLFTDYTVPRLCAEVESLRARALAARHAYLVDEFCNVARSKGFKPNIQSRLIEVDHTGNKKLLVVPAVGIPDARVYHEIHDEFYDGGKTISAIHIIYDHRGVRKLWLNHLAWLNSHVPLKTNPVTEAAKLLAGLTP